MKGSFFAKGLAVLLGLELAFSIGISSHLPVYGAESETEDIYDSEELEAVGACNHSQAEAVQWARDRGNEHWYYDDASGETQCTELVAAYYVYLTGSGDIEYWRRRHGHAYNYINESSGACLSGWSRPSVSNIQPGDIFIQTGGEYGHVGIVVEVNGSSVLTAETRNFGTDIWGVVRTINGGKDWNGVGGNCSFYSRKSSDFNGIIRPDFSGVPVSVSFSPWENGNYTYVREKDAAIGQEIIVSGGSCGENGMYLYDENGNLLAYAKNPTYTQSKVFFKINEECGYTLTPGTTYKYKFYADVNGTRYWSDWGSFTTTGTKPSSSISVTFNPWENSNYTYVREKDAAIGQEINVSGGSCGENGMYLYDVNENYLASASNPTYTLAKVYFKINEECGYTLTGGTTYKYKFYADVNGIRYWSDWGSFTTTPSTDPQPTVNVTFNSWGNEKYTYIGESDAAIGQNIVVSRGNWTIMGMILYNNNEIELARKEQAPTSGISNYYFKIKEELGYTLSPGTTYKYKFYAVVDGNTYYSGRQEFTTVPHVEVQMSWKNPVCYPGDRNALVSVDAVASTVAMYTEASIKVWDDNGTLVASKTEDCSNYRNSKMNIWYDIYSETNALLNKGSKYKYQISTECNGEAFNSPVYSFETGDDTKLHFGMDVSEHQGIINWDSAAGYVDFAILRCGFGSDFTDNDDKQWQSNVAACERLGIPYGVYLYSYAENDEEAASEAEHVIRLLQGKHPSLPIYYDLEDPNTTGRLTNDRIKTQFQIFAGTLENAGYEVGVYASENWWKSKLTDSVYQSYKQWVAAYGGSFGYLCPDYDMWQYTSGGKVPGVQGNTDLIYCYDPLVIVGENVSVSGVYLPSEKTVIKGETLTLTPVITPSNATIQTVKWKSSDDKIATVDKDGVVTGVSVGEAEITVTTDDGGFEDICMVDVIGKDAVVSVTGVYLPAKKSVKKGETLTLTPVITPSNATIQTVKWKSSNSKIATVNDGGVVTGVKGGEATITVTTDDGGFEDTCKIEVVEDNNVKAVTGVYLPSKKSVKTGETITLTPVITPSDATVQTVKWKSSNSNVAVVDAYGVVTGIMAGDATITVTTDDGGFEDICEVEVVEGSKVVSVTGVYLTSKKSVKKGESITLSPVITPSDATIRTVTWKSSNEKIAVVDAYGIVTGIKPGNSIVTVITDDGGFEDTCEVEVVGTSDPDDPDDVTKSDYTLIPGEVRRLNLSAVGQYAYGVRWTIQSSYPKGCVTVKNGVATAKKQGAAVVSASYGGTVKTFNITVDGTVPENKVAFIYGKAGKLSATKTVKANVGDFNKKATVSIPSNLRSLSGDLNYEVKNPDVCDVKGPYINGNGSKASFEIVPKDAGATYIVWSIEDGSGNEASAYTKIIVKKPLTDITVAQGSELSLKPGEGTRLTVIETKDNTDTKDLSFSVQGSGIKVSKSGYVVGTSQYGGGMVIVRSGKAYASVRVSVSGGSGNYLTINKPSVTVISPRLGVKTTTLKVVNPMNKAERPSVTWGIVGSPKGISVNGNGVISVEANASPGCYEVSATPTDSGNSYSTAYCELIVK